MSNTCMFQSHMTVTYTKYRYREIQMFAKILKIGQLLIKKKENNTTW